MVLQTPSLLKAILLVEPGVAGKAPAAIGGQIGDDQVVQMPV